MTPEIQALRPIYRPGASFVRPFVTSHASTRTKNLPSRRRPPFPVDRSRLLPVSSSTVISGRPRPLRAFMHLALRAPPRLAVPRACRRTPRRALQKLRARKSPSSSDDTFTWIPLPPAVGRAREKSCDSAALFAKYYSRARGEREGGRGRNVYRQTRPRRLSPLEKGGATLCRREEVKGE